MNHPHAITQHTAHHNAAGYLCRRAVLEGERNRTTHTENINGITRNNAYGYDALNRLITAADGAGGVESHAYDPLNNLKSRTVSNITTTYNHDAANQLTEVMQGDIRIKGFVYDAAGNLKQKCESNNGVPVTLTGNSATACSGGPVTIANHGFTYDDQGRRLSKTVGASTTNYLYNGQDILAEYQGWSAALAHLTHGPGTDEPLQRVQGTAGQATGMSYMQDGLGSVVAAVPHDAVNGGATVGTQRFDAWGNQVAQSGAAVPLYGYTGREPDATGLIYYRARYYDPSVQRFTQRDPIGWDGGINAYAYVNNNPVNFADPLGLVPANPALNMVADATQLYFGRTMTDASPVGAQSLSTGSRYAESDFVCRSPTVECAGAVAMANLRRTDTPLGDAISPLELLNPASLVRGAAIGAGAVFGSLRVIGGETATMAGTNAANGVRLAQQLRVEQAGSQFTAAGTLTPEAIANSQMIMQSSRLANPGIPTGFAKYTTAPLPGPSGGSITTRFYMNPSTGDVFYGLDYKTLFLP